MHRAVVIALIVLGCALLGWGAPPPALSDGISLVSRGNYAGAVLALQPLEEDGAGNALYHYWLGRAYYGLRNFRLAAAQLGAAVELDAAHEEACYWHARALRMAGQDDDALTAYAAYAARFPRNPALRGEFAALQALAGGGRLEPLLTRPDRRFTLQYDPAERMAATVCEEVERARRDIGAAVGAPIEGFRVLLFASLAAYRRYAGLALGERTPLHTAAFSSPGLLVLWSPSDWPDGGRDTREMLRHLVRHEMAHLAIMQHGRGEGVPLWLHEGLACYLGGWGGQQSGRLPARPLSLPELERAFTVGSAGEASTAYAQAQAMVTVMAARLGIPALFTLLDTLAAGTPLPAAYPKVADEPVDTFLAQWPERYRAMAQGAGAAAAPTHRSLDAPTPP